MNEETKGLAVVEEPREAFSLVSASELSDGLKALVAFQHVVRTQLIPDVDYGVIPGTSKPTLYKPGAEKLVKLHGYTDIVEIMDKTEEWSKENPLFRYLVKVTLIHARTGTKVSEGVGECNSMEEKFRWRKLARKCPACGAEAIIKGKEEYGGGFICFKKKNGCGAKFADNDKAITSQVEGKVENEEVFSLVNTILKMAKKRAYVDATLSACRLSAVFTQDVEDLKANGQLGSVEEAVVVQPAPQAPVAVPGTPTVATPAPTATTRPAPMNDKKVSPKQVAMLWAVARKAFGDETYADLLFQAIAEQGIELPIKTTQSGHEQPDVQQLTMSQWQAVIESIAPGTLKPREA